MSVVKIRGAGIEGTLQRITEWATRAFARAHVSGAAIGGQGYVHCLGVRVVGKKCHVPEDAVAPATWPLLDANLKSVVVGHPIVAVFKDVGESLEGTTSLGSDSDGPWVQVNVLAEVRPAEPHVRHMEHGVRPQLLFDRQVPVIDRRSYPWPARFQTKYSHRRMKCHAWGNFGKGKALRETRCKSSCIGCQRIVQRDETVWWTRFGEVNPKAKGLADRSVIQEEAWQSGGIEYASS